MAIKHLAVQKYPVGNGQRRWRQHHGAKINPLNWYQNIVYRVVHVPGGEFCDDRSHVCDPSLLSGYGGVLHLDDNVVALVHLALPPDLAQLDFEGAMGADVPLLSMALKNRFSLYLCSLSAQ